MEVTMKMVLKTLSVGSVARQTQQQDNITYGRALSDKLAQASVFI